MQDARTASVRSSAYLGRAARANVAKAAEAVANGGGTMSTEGSVADRRKIHAASMLYHIQNGSVPKLAGTSN